MKKILCLLLLAALLLVNCVAAVQELNFTKQSEEHLASMSEVLPNLRIASIRQDPFPGNPGQYMDVYFKIDNIGGGVIDPVFEINLPFPLSVYPESEIKKSISSIDSGEKITLRYRIRIDENAIPGDYEAEFRAYTEKNIYYPNFFSMKVDDVTTNFDVALHEVNKDGASVAIANVGKNAANSITVKLDNNSDFELFGPSNYIIGNLNNGDYTILNLLLAPKPGNKNPKLELQIEYTDIIGNRRSVNKVIGIPLNINIEKGFNELTGYVVQGNAENESSNGGVFAYASVILAFALVAVIIYYKRKGKNNEDEE